MKLLLPACLVLMLFLSACNITQYVAVPINYTPKSYLGHDSTTVLLINRVDMNHTDIGSQKKREVLKSAAYACISYAQNVLNQQPHINVLNIVDSVSFKTTPDSVSYLALKYHAKYVLVLQSFSADIALADYENSMMYYNTNVTVSFLLYEANGIYYKKLDGVANDPNAQVPDVNIFASILLHPTVKGNKSALKLGAEHATQNALQDYLPYTFVQHRPIYTDDYLQPAIKELIAGNFEKADSLLEPYLQDVNPQKASKAAYNLAVVFESEGDVDSAYDMAQQSLDKFRNNYAANLMEGLKED